MRKTFVSILIVFIFCIGFIVYFKKIDVHNIGETNKVTFVCEASKTIDAIFYIDNDKVVDLVLSDGRKLSVPHAISASGARYANADETFAFWNKGNTAFITEGSDGAETYSNCVQSN